MKIISFISIFGLINSSESAVKSFTVDPSFVSLSSDHEDFQQVDET